MDKKICYGCNREKCLSEFRKTKAGLCKLCRETLGPREKKAATAKSWRLYNPEKHNLGVERRKRKASDHMKKRYLENTELFRQKSRNNYRKHREKRILSSKIFRQKNPEKYKNYPSVKRKNEKDKFQRKFVKKYKVKTQLRNAVNRVILGRSGRRTLQIVGVATLEEFIEKMNFACDNPNWSEDGWHLDHIWQLHWFDMESHDLGKLCEVINHWSNLRPFSKDSNLTRKRYDFTPLKEEDILKYEFLLKPSVVKMIKEYFQSIIPWWESR